MSFPHFRVFLAAAMLPASVIAQPASGIVNLEVAEALEASSVKALPDSDAAASAKKAALEVALERARSAADAGQGDYAKALLTDVDAALPVDAKRMASASAKTTGISAVAPVRVAEGNPYIKQMQDGAKSDLTKADIPWKKCVQDFNIFDGISGPYGTRDVAAAMAAYLWLYANPASPCKGDPEILRRFLRRAHAYADAIDVHAATIKAGQNLFDDFAIAPAASALREFSQLYPGLLLPSQKAQWDRAMQKGGEIMWGKARDRDGTYANIDLALAFELLNFGSYLKNDEMLAKAKFLVDAQEKNIYPDGAIAYIWHQNESHGYHDSCCRDLARYYEASGYPKALDLLKKTEWYGPVTSGRLAEFWTVPSWKGTWNSAKSSPAGGEWVAGITGNSYLRGMRDAALAEKPDLRHWPDARLQVAWYRKDVKPKALPDNYTVIDRNTMGPRAWYGRFNYAGTVRPVPPTEPGLATLMGCQVTQPDFSLQKAVMGIFPRVRVKKDAVAADGSENKAAWAWLTTGLKGAAVMGRHFSAIGASYQLHAFGSSTKGADSDWMARQLWIGLPDRIVGLLEVAPMRENAAAWEVDGIVRLSFGGTALGSPKKIEADGQNAFRYDDLLVKIHGHNYGGVRTNEVPFRLPKAPVTDIVLQDPVSLKDTANVTRTYPLSSSYYFIVEIRPSWAKGDAVVRRLDSPGGQNGLQVDCGGRRYAVWFNAGDKPMAVDLKSLVQAGIASSVRDSSAPDARPIAPAPATVNVPPRQAALFVSSQDKVDHEAGWKSFEQMVSATK